MARLAEHAEISLLFTDMGLPGGMNGRQLAEAAYLQHPNLKVLFTSGYATEVIARDGCLDSGIALLNKPFSYVTLAEKLRHVLDS